MAEYHIWTIGCQMNKAESERLGALLRQQGYREAASAGEADVIVVNSCVVRKSAETKAVNRLEALKPLKQANPEIRLALTGCMVDSNEGKLRQDFPLVDYFFKPGEIPHWLECGPSAPATPEKELPVSAFLPIIRGCDNFCSYCIVPYRRGREKSRSVDEICREAEEMVRRGAREIVLLGQNVDSYGNDLPAAASAKAGGKPDLADLLGELNGIPGLKRLRFLTNHPKDMSDRLIEAIAGLEKVCEQISLPVQSGDDRILKLMRRDYTVDDYRRLVSRIRARVPGIALSTDVIVGFPGETEAEFRHTLDLLAELRFDAVHVAAYSPRPETLAARELADDVPAEEKKERLSQVEALQEKIASEINSGLLGETVEVLVEGRKKGKWQGRTRTDKLVFFTDTGNHRGELVEIEIEKTSPWSFQGKLRGG